MWRASCWREPVSSRAILVGTAIELARTLLPLPKKVRLLGVTVSNFEGDQDAGGTQMVFDFEDDDPLPA